MYVSIIAYNILSYGGLVGRGCHDVHIRDLRTCTHVHLGFADLHILDLRTCTHAHLGFADLHIRDLRKCNCFHVVATWQPRGEHVVTTWQPRGNNCTSANRVCASPQIPDVHVCTSANRVCASPQIPDVHVCTSANRVCACHDSCDLPGHRTILVMYPHPNVLKHLLLTVSDIWVWVRVCLGLGTRLGDTTAWRTCTCMFTGREHLHVHVHNVCMCTQVYYSTQHQCLVHMCIVYIRHFSHSRDIINPCIRCCCHIWDWGRDYHVHRYNGCTSWFLQEGGMGGLCFAVTTMSFIWSKVG